MTVSPFSSKRIARHTKRGVDLVGAVGGLAVTGPVLAVAALAVRARLGSPIFFRQKRPGLGGNPFVLYKLRTMREPSPTEDRLATDADRLTALGKLLRETSIDELPSLINVLKGDMSLVGPRPLLMEYLARYTPEQARRHDVKPGITGLAQVRGRNSLEWEEKLRLDVEYVDRWTLALDLEILLETVVKVLSRSGVSHEGHVTMPEFMGSEDS
jgi:lipopolysaccharide/colanic/teichoic acid biosynthesis glycosyltransferase